MKCIDVYTCSPVVSEECMSYLGFMTEYVKATFKHFKIPTFKQSNSVTVDSVSPKNGIKFAIPCILP